MVIKRARLADLTINHVACQPYSVPAGLAAGGAAAAAFLLVLSNKENFILNEAAAAAATSFVVEQTTKTHVPLQHESLSLVGSGVRQVTFLNVSVYVAALYIDSDLKSQIKGSQLWSNFTANTMAANTVEGRWFAKDLVESKITSLLTVRF